VQVALRWVVQQGIPVIPKATNRVYLEEDFDLFSFRLTDSEMATLTAANSPPPQKPDDDQDCAVP
jgi:2,5-diketo-D-gluconate reductase A